MNATHTRNISIALVLFATVALPRAGSAQYRLPTIVSTDKADSLHAFAVQFVQTGRWHEAARLYRRSAEFRAVEDPVGFQCLTEAAAVAYAAGDRSAARSDMAHAAERALARGDIKSAAMAYLDAAWIAQEQKKPDRVLEWGHRAEILADSPLLSETDRSAIQRRIERVPDGTRLVVGKRVNG
ncbi:MAG TPA: hypothetical protein VJU17_11995 [Gemmatimonadales bacterium]|nr:hypothetical protein [Gemmatimonadales bacterium]